MKTAKITPRKSVDTLLTKTSDNPPPAKSCSFVEATSLVPPGWATWFWVKISQDAPFSWGDNNRSMVLACDFKNHCEDRLSDVASEEDVPQADIDQFLQLVESLGTAYVDLEN